MNIRQLQHFLAVMDTGSLSAAAEAVHLSIPALSRSLKTLEEELRVSLFDRTNRRLRPTPYAWVYVERARRIVFDEREGARALGLMKNGAYGPLAFGLGSSIANDLLAPLIQQLISSGPTLRIQAQVQSTDVLLDFLRREKLDFFIGDVSSAASSTDLHSEPLHQCTFGWFARPDHPLAGKQGITIDQLKMYPIIGSGYASDILAYSMASLYGLELPLEKNFSVNINNVEALHKLIASTDMIAPSTYVAMLQPLRVKSVAPLDVTPALNLDMKLGIIRLALRTLVPSSHQAFEIIRNYFSNIEGEISQYILSN
ncbi:LysR substrate-binding domain-containing protein [Pseudomonas sp. GCM10022186]|uniref:LysR substrate-binding domain-containing protein n=1 Tax=Pseudomonas sp. GCM10022186 TaxID=3252650 RepID=UPI0036174AA5